MVYRFLSEAPLAQGRASPTSGGPRRDYRKSPESWEPRRLGQGSPISTEIVVAMMAVWGEVRPSAINSTRFSKKQCPSQPQERVHSIREQLLSDDPWFAQEYSSSGDPHRAGISFAPGWWVAITEQVEPMDEFLDEPSKIAYAWLLEEARQVAVNSRHQLRQLRQRYGLPPRMLEALQKAGMVLERQRKGDRRKDQERFSGAERRQSVRRSS